MDTVTPMIGLQQQHKQGIGLNQGLFLSAHMQQAISVLQLPLQGLDAFIDEQVTTNPILEKDEEESPQEELDEIVDRGEMEEKEVSIDDRDLSILNHLDEEYRDHLTATELSQKVSRTSEDEKLQSYLEQSICGEETLNEHLMSQARESFSNEEDLKTAEILIGYIDPQGFLKNPLEEIEILHQIPLERIKRVLGEIQHFDPVGVAATSIQESLLIQLKFSKKQDTLAYEIIKGYYDDLLHNRLPLMAKQLKCDVKDIQQAIDSTLSKLDLRPGLQYASIVNQAIVPDVSLRIDGEQIVVDVDREYVSPIRINRKYLKMLEDPATSKETKHFLKHHFFSARWLEKNLKHRYSTVERIAMSLAEKQRDFFMNPEGELKPLAMKILAEELGVHESTIARTVANKYINSPRGLFPLKAFFTNCIVTDEGTDLSSKTVKNMIAELIAQEDHTQPLSDEVISSLLKEKGIPCARRTVAKYRGLLKIGTAHQRRRFS